VSNLCKKRTDEILLEEGNFHDDWAHQEREEGGEIIVEGDRYQEISFVKKRGGGGRRISGIRNSRKKWSWRDARNHKLSESYWGGRRPDVTSGGGKGPAGKKPLSILEFSRRTFGEQQFFKEGKGELRDFWPRGPRLTSTVGGEKTVSAGRRVCAADRGSPVAQMATGTLRKGGQKFNTEGTGREDTKIFALLKKVMLCHLAQ